jgi:hypothetical protein
MSLNWLVFSKDLFYYRLEIKSFTLIPLQFRWQSYTNITLDVRSYLGLEDVTNG